MATSIGRDESPAEYSTIEAQRQRHSASPSVASDYGLVVGGDDGEDGDDDDMRATRRFEFVVGVVVPTIFGLITVVGLVGNLLVIVVVAFNRRTISPTNVLIVNLAVADLLFIVTCVPFTAVGYATTVWPFGDVWCKIYQYSVHVTTYASVYTLVMMSFDRYLAVVHAVRSMAVRTARNASIVAAVSWVLILAANYPVIVEHKSVEYDFYGEARSACVNAFIYRRDDGDDFDYHDHGKAYYACFFAFAYVIPLAAVSLLYGLMMRRLLRGTRPGARRTAAAAAGDVSRGKQRRATRLVVAVVVTFAVCWLPLQLVLVVQFVCRYTDHSLRFVAAKIAFSCLAYTNSCLNPILYAFLSENFRKSFRRLLCLVLCGAGSRCSGRKDQAALLRRAAEDRKTTKDRENAGKDRQSVAHIDMFKTNEGLINHGDDCCPEKMAETYTHQVQDNETASKF